MKITDKQQEYIDILFNDLRFSLQEKRAAIMLRFGVEYPDELTKIQASQLISDLKEYKGNFSNE